MELLYLILFGYLIGSVSPGYFFGKIVKGIDVRERGPNRNTGATNTFYVVGPVWGVIAGLVDFLKAPTAYLIAVQTFSPDLAIIVGLAAAVGHIFPFYLGFRGGRGVASLYGLLAISLFFTTSVYALSLFAGTVFYAISVSQRPEIKGLLAEAQFRKFLKLAALILPIGFLAISESLFLATVLILLAVSLAFDISRFLFPAFNQYYLGLRMVAKYKEAKRFSGYTLFLLSSFLLFQFFSKEIAAMSLVFFIVGDVFAPFGQVFMAKEILRGKTWGGAFLIFILAFISGLFLKSLVSFSLSLNAVALAAFLTAFFDQFSFLLDDNILVPLGTAAVLTFLV